MKRLYLLRHAQSPGDFNVSDHQRCLSDHGIRQATQTGKHLESHPPIDLALYSDSLRTTQTFEAVTKHASIKTSSALPALYNASCGDLMHIIQQQDNNTTASLLLIAHNPGIHQLSGFLLPPTDIDKIGFTYPPSTLSIIDCPIEKWADLKNGNNHLVDTIYQD